MIGTNSVRIIQTNHILFTDKQIVFALIRRVENAHSLQSSGDSK